MADAQVIERPRTSPMQRLFARLRQRAVAEHAPAEPSLGALAVKQALWGEGFVTPGGQAEIKALAAPLGLVPGKAVLEVAAGMGGAVRTLAGFGVEAHGLERDGEIARAGQAISAARGLGRHASVSVYDPEAFDLPAARYDAVVACDATYAVRDKERFLRVLRQGLRAGGALAMTELVLDRAATGTGILAEWAEREPNPPTLWTVERYEDCLKSLGFTLRETRDASREYRAVILAGWGRLLARPDLRRLPRGPVLAEAERWLRAVQALDAGALRRVQIAAGARR